MDYRREIDGLRAVAVLPVILFHAGLTVFRGGFVGVDVFFVLSGYLITAILLAELQTGRYSIARFYERRIRRILPALVVVLLACIPPAWAWMRPDQMAEFGQSLVAVVLFASNILFWRTTGYFDAPADLKPLLHTWSLAVEEQYYLVFPLALAVLWRFGRARAFWVMVGLAAFSLAAAEWGWRHKPVAAFYLAPTRAWELFAGSLCAFALTGPRPPRPNDLLAGVGLAAILAAIFLLDGSQPWPSLWTLIPVGGTALIVLFAGPKTWTARLLGAPPLVGIGLISYSAYLWHQPLFAFARLRSLAEPSTALMLGLAAVSLGLAWASWAWVEQPFRRRPLPVLPQRGRLFGAALATGLGIAALGGVAVLTDGLPGRLTPEARAAAEAGVPVWRDCGADVACRIGADQGQGTGIAFVGDSHLGRYTWALDRALAERGLSANLVTGGFCAPLMDFGTEDPVKNAAQCRDAFGPAFRAVLDDPGISTVVLAAEWANYTSGTRFMDPVSAYDYGPDGQANRDPAGNPAEFARAFAATVAAVRATGKRLVVIEGVPEYDMLVPSAVVQRLMLGQGLDDLRQPLAAYQARNADAVAAFDRDRAGITWVRPQDVLCPDGFCTPFDAAGLPLLNDGSHLTARGLALVLPSILQALDLPAN